jgi:deoxyribodipyrimidine photo-lyase
MAADAAALLWFRQDLRLADNPALSAAVAAKLPLVCCYILDDAIPGRWRLGGASRWWLHHSLAALSAALEKRGGRLILQRGDALEIVPRLAREIGARAVFWNRCYEPFAVARDAKLKEVLNAAGVKVSSFNAALLHEPWEIKTRIGEPYKVYTPFWRACLASCAARKPIVKPAKIEFAARELQSDCLADWALRPEQPNWAKAFDAEWRPGEAGAQAALKTFLENKLCSYPAARDELGAPGASRLSPHLHFGEISPAQIAAAIDPEAPGADKFMAEIGWREFSHHLLFHWPTLPEKNWRAQFDRFAWRADETGYRAWTRGETGYPIVDAAMRELWTTGYMHNRARMIAASFLIKHLLIDWRRGEDWFWDTLVDADLANNAASWQWVAGSGADASPYFRIFNPVTQGQRYDADGAYVRRWLPVLSKLPDKHLHMPWTAPADVLQRAGLVLGADYPKPIVDHAEARARALSAFAAI